MGEGGWVQGVGAAVDTWEVLHDRLHQDPPNVRHALFLERRIPPTDRIDGDVREEDLGLHAPAKRVGKVQDGDDDRT